MNRTVRLSTAIVLALSASTALAQTTGTTQPFGPGTGGVGVDVWSTLYPRSPASTITQTQPTTTTTQPIGIEPIQPVGVPAGNIILYPSITGAAFFDDNVFARNTNREGDWAFVLRPELAWRSNNWANAQVGGAGFVEKRWYRKFTSEDQLNAGATVGGTVQPDANTQLVGRLTYLHSHEDRGTSDSISAPTFARPLEYNQLEAAGAINKRFERVWTSLGAAAAFIHFRDPTLSTGGTVSQAYRNGDIIRVPARLGYVVAPLTSVFVEVSGNRRNFRDDTFDSRGYRVLGGMLFEPGPGARVRGEAYAGYMRQNYNGAAMLPISTWTWGAAMALLVAPRVTAVVEARRDAKEVSASGGVTPGDGISVIETLASARADFQVAPNFVVGAGASYLTDEFLGNARTDRSLSPLFSAKYFVSRHLTLGFDYRNLRFDSRGAGISGYYKNVYLFSAHGRF